MTDIDDLRNRLAVLCGWTNARPTDRFAPQLWAKGGFSTNYHPFKPNDYNAIIAAWPGSWRWKRLDGAWVCWDEDSRYEEVHDTGDEYADRLRLTVAVLEAIRQ